MCPSFSAILSHEDCSLLLHYFLLEKDPPKNETNINVMPLSANTSTSTSAIVKRGRGRPRKNASSQAVGQPNKVNLLSYENCC